MAEDTRLKHSKEMLYVKTNQTTNPINRNILNKQFTLKNYLKKQNIIII